MNAPATAPSPLRTGLAVTGLLAAPVLVVAGVVGGGAAVAGAALGLVVVAAFFAVSKLVLGVVARRSPTMLLPAALGTYIGKLLVLGACLIAIGGSDEDLLTAFAWAVVVGVLGWVFAELWAAVRTKVPFYDPAEPPRAGVLPSGGRAGERKGDRAGQRSGERTEERTEDRPADPTGDLTGERMGDRTGERTGDRTGERTGDREER